MFKVDFLDPFQMMIWLFCRKIDSVLIEQFTDLSEGNILILLFVLLGSHLNEVLIKGRT